jgi:ribosomal protein S18 acetylase RimI-like enzyme
VAVRKCTIDDAPEVAALLHELWPVELMLDLSRTEELLLEMQQQPDVYSNLVAVGQSGEVLGFLSIVFYKSFLHHTGSALINELVVRPDARGMGVGRALVNSAVQEASLRGMDDIEVSTGEANDPAIALYRAAGLDETYVMLGRNLRRER